MERLVFVHLCTFWVSSPKKLLAFFITSYKRGISLEFSRVFQREVLKNRPERGGILHQGENQQATVLFLHAREASAFTRNHAKAGRDSGRACR